MNLNFPLTNLNIPIKLINNQVKTNAIVLMLLKIILPKQVFDQ